MYACLNESPIPKERITNTCLDANRAHKVNAMKIQTEQVNKLVKNKQK